MSLNLRNIVLVTSGSVAGLWLQQAWLGMFGEPRTIVLQSGFMVGMGLATFLVTRRWLQRQSSIVVEKDALDQRLGVLTRELEDERTVAALGENVARLAHGIKNAVHSLRGFVHLIEPQLEDEDRARSALRGLRSAIDDLESLARTTLSPETSIPSQDVEAAEASQPPREAAGGKGIAPVLEQALAEVRRSNPGVEWDVRSEGSPSRVTIPDSSLSETLVILLRNAVEAMQGRGRGTLETEVRDGEWKVRIGDEGPGLTESQIEEIFKPGFTTKSTGSGYGLFLARRIAEEHGGSITASARPGRGALFELILPVAGSE
jgi:signal transduction histidine kinase